MTNASASSSSALRAMEDKIDELPLLPQVLVKLMQLRQSSDSYFDDFETLVMEDPTFAVRVIAIANSSASSPVAPITTIRDAITRMGAATISALVASLAVQKVFMPSEPSQVRLWSHSVLTALAAQEICKLAPLLKVNPSEAYLAGLLHDIGRFVMLEHAAPELRKVDESNWENPEQLIAADVEIYTYTHCELGYLACKHWGLPDAVSDVVRTHHDVLDCSIEPGSHAAITYCVQLADELCIAILEHPSNADSSDVQSIVEERCQLTVAADQWFNAPAICEKIPKIRDSGTAMLAGLGLG